MTEGTKSYLFGCHHFLLHPLCVLRAWKQEYGAWPKWWQVIGIFCHDIGVCGRQYLSDDSAKHGHWKTGADLTYTIVEHVATRLLGMSLYRAFKLASKAYDFVAGHCPKESGWPEGPLFRADKCSWIVAPETWMWWNYWFEGFKGYTPKKWKRLVAENLRRDNPLGSHELYIKYRRGE